MKVPAKIVSKLSQKEQLVPSNKMTQSLTNTPMPAQRQPGRKESFKQLNSQTSGLRVSSEFLRSLGSMNHQANQPNKSRKSAMDIQKQQSHAAELPSNPFGKQKKSGSGGFQQSSSYNRAKDVAFKTTGKK